MTNRAGEWRVLVADDEPAARRGVRQLLAPFADFRVVGECRNGIDLLDALDALKPDLVFLDIQMPGFDGFETIRRRTPERMPTVVFFTAYEEHALRAFEAQAFDYLVKPVTAARFATLINRLRRLRREEASPSRNQSIVVSTSRGLVVLPLSDVDWIESADNYARIWIGARSHLVREPLRALETRAKAAGFRRAHRCALVRVSAVAAVSKAPNGESVALLQSGTQVPISRRRRAAFMSAVRTGEQG
ncbi:MAG: response regulator [Acidobacteria bacterium]|nr:response regulator [Acidobacteriota bacterium]